MSINPFTEEKGPRPEEIWPEGRTAANVVDTIRNYPKNVWLMLRNKTASADRPAALSLALSILALLLAGSVAFVVIAWVAALLLAFVPSSGKSPGPFTRVAKTTALFIPLLIVSPVGMFIAPVLGVIAASAAVIRIQKYGYVGKKAAWAIALGTAATLLGMGVGVAALMGTPDPVVRRQDPVAEYFSPVQSSSPTAATTAALPRVSYSEYKGEDALETYGELKDKGYDVKAVFKERSLADKYGEATSVFDALARGEETAVSAEDFIIGDLDQKGEEITLSIVSRPKPAEKKDPPKPAIPDAGNQAPLPTVRPVPPPRPVAPPNPQPPANLPLKAICNDGTVSYQNNPSGADYRGMCSHHRGIRQKLGRVP